MEMTKENTKIFMHKNEKGKYEKNSKPYRPHKPHPRDDFEIIPREDRDKETAVVKFKKIVPDCKLPERGTLGSAGYDIFANLNEAVTIQPNETVKISTGFATSFKNNYVGLVYSRSGLATKKGLVVCQGTAVIDSDYRGEWFIPIYNQSKEPQTIEPNDRIAQLIMQPTLRIRAIEVNDLENTKRGKGGFGSTGK